MTRRITGSRPDMTDDDAEGGSERDEVRRAPGGPNLLSGGSTPQQRGTLPRQAVRGGPPSASEKVQMREMLARRRRALDNPFYGHDDDLQIPTPPDDESWHYGWARVTVGGKQDSRNLQVKLHGRLPWEPAPLAEMTGEWQSRLGLVAAKDGDYAGYAAIEDLVLMRCDRVAYHQFVEANDLRSDDLVMGVKQKWLDILDRTGMRPKQDAFDVDDMVREEMV